VVDLGNYSQLVWQYSPLLAALEVLLEKKHGRQDYTIRVVDSNGYESQFKVSTILAILQLELLP
jgi:hypothetical protein